MNSDAATKLTLDYLSILERRLAISWESGKQPIYIIDKITDGQLTLLRKDLNDLLSGTSGEAARAATEQYGTDHIQTVGFGLSFDFDQFVKLGFLYGDRVVLWDIIYNRFLAEDKPTPPSKGAIGQAACNLLLLQYSAALLPFSHIQRSGVTSLTR